MFCNKLIFKDQPHLTFRYIQVPGYGLERQAEEQVNVEYSHPDFNTREIQTIY